MISHFIRRFAAFRELERDAKDARETLQRENAAKLQAQDRVRNLESENERLRDELAESRAKNIKSTELVADWLSQQMFGRRIYADAPALPEHPQEAELIPRPRAQARTIVDEMTRQFYEQLAKQQEESVA